MHDSFSLYLDGTPSSTSQDPGQYSYQLCLMVVHQDGIRHSYKRFPHSQSLEKATRASMAYDELSLSHVSLKVGCIFEHLYMQPIG